ncbi:MAG: hypothetical protein IIV66_06795, partial [Alistipes sp.]|nr:hypothetical protein [Alistipes sp.]
MKSDTVEGGRVAAAVQMQALAHPEVAFQFLRDGKQVLSTPGNGGLEAAVYCVYGRECARMVKVESRWDNYSLTGFVSKPTDARPSRNLQTFFVNNRPVKSKLLISALEEAYRNQIMVGKFPACVLHLNLPANTVDVNVHPAKTEVKFLSEKAVFDCVHYGVLGALNKQTDRPQVQFKQAVPPEASAKPPVAPVAPKTSAPAPAPKTATPRQENFFRTMSTEEFKTFSTALKDAPMPKKEAAIATAAIIERQTPPPLRETVILPTAKPVTEKPAVPAEQPKLPPMPEPRPEPKAVSAPKPTPIPQEEPEMEQSVLDMPKEQDWRMVGELYNSYIIVEQGDNAFLIDKHA